MNQYAQPRFPADVILREKFDYKKIPPDDHINTLENYLQLSDWLVPEEANINRFVLRHPDLQPGNLFVSDSMDLLGIIDWQHSSILPIFLHCGIPHHFQNYGDRDSMELNMPKLPDNFSELSSEDQEAANELFRRRELHFLYIFHTKASNKDHMDALGAPYSLLRKRLYHYAAIPWDGNSVYLKVDLIRVSQLWGKITAPQDGIAVECPINFCATEIKECFRLESELLETEEVLKKMRENLAMDDEGGVATEYYDAIKAHVQKVKAECVTVAETDLEKKAILCHYPFDDHDESGIT